MEFSLLGLGGAWIAVSVLGVVGLLGLSEHD